MPSTLVTGANRGLGLEFVKQYAAAGWRVYACARKPAEAHELAALASGSGGEVTVHSLDAEDHAGIEALGRELAGAAIDVLLNNAGVMGRRDPFGANDYEDWLRTLRINTLGPMKVAEVFVEQVARSERRVIANVTSKMGSIADNTSGGAYAYRSSKAALNAATRSMAHDLRRRKVVACVLHPGWVATDMGGPSAPLGSPESVEGMRRVIDALTPERSSGFFDYTGAEVPW